MGEKSTGVQSSQLNFEDKKRLSLNIEIDNSIIKNSIKQI